MGAFRPLGTRDFADRGQTVPEATSTAGAPAVTVPVPAVPSAFPVGTIL